MRPTKYKKDKTPIFICKLHRILSDADNQLIVKWTNEHNGFIILNLNLFTTQVLPKYFKHSNYNSFVRQLNMYSFNKIRYTDGDSLYEHAYQNELFAKDNQQDHRLIRRKQAPSKSQSLNYNQSNYEGNFDSLWFQDNNDNDSQCQDNNQIISQKLEEVRKKQQKLQQICIKLISQNRVLLSQNQELALKIKKESKKKERVLDQVFRIIGISIAEFWDQFCQDTETLEQKTNNFKQIYKILMNYIQNNELSQILKTLQFFISPTSSDKKPKGKTFKVVNLVEQANFISSYTEQQVQEFISKTNLILEEGGLN